MLLAQTSHTFRLLKMPVGCLLLPGNWPGILGTAFKPSLVTQFPQIIISGLPLRMLILTSESGTQVLGRSHTIVLHMAQRDLIYTLTLTELYLPTIPGYKDCSEFGIRLLAAIGNGPLEALVTMVENSISFQVLTRFSAHEPQSRTQLRKPSGQRLRESERLSRSIFLTVWK
jgi:hypothetical protein